MDLCGGRGGNLRPYRNHYNEVRPHSSPQYFTPAEFKLEFRKELQFAVF
jgi:putative transposase